NRRDYYFGAYGYSPQQAVDNTSVSWFEIFRRFTDAAGKTLLIVDTCHAGGVLNGNNTKGLIDSQDLNDMLKTLAWNPARGFVTLAASTIQEIVSDDSVFFRALFKGLSQGVTPNKKLVDVLDLVTYVSKEVSDATKNQQHVIYKAPEGGGWPI